MFKLKNLYKQAILDGGEGEGGGEGGGEPQGGQENVLDDAGGGQEATTDYNVETFLTNFDGDEREKAHRYASNYADEKGNLDISKMIKSGFNLESKFGAFTGAPDDYNIPTPEYMEGDVNTDDPYLKEFMELAKESNMNQESFEKFMDIHLRASIAPPVDIKEMENAIGPEFNAMRSNMAGFFKSRLDEESFNKLNSMITDVESFKALYSVVKASKPTKIDDSIRDNFNQAEMKDQMEAEYHAKDDNGNPKMQDPLYAKSWRERWEPFISNNT